MYTLGSLFYAIYFFVSFPMFYRIDEDPRAKRWTLSQYAYDRCGMHVVFFIIIIPLSMMLIGVASSTQQSQCRCCATFFRFPYATCVQPGGRHAGDHPARSVAHLAGRD
jgi:hypothetical protein